MRSLDPRFRASRLGAVQKSIFSPIFIFYEKVRFWSQKWLSFWLLLAFKSVLKSTQKSSWISGRFWDHFWLIFGSIRELLGAFGGQFGPKRWPWSTYFPPWCPLLPQMTAQGSSRYSFGPYLATFGQFWLLFRCFGNLSTHLKPVWGCFCSLFSNSRSPPPPAAV